MPIQLLFQHCIFRQLLYLFQDHNPLLYLLKIANNQQLLLEKLTQRTSILLVTTGKRLIWILFLMTLMLKQLTM